MNKIQLIAGLRVQMTGNRGNIYTLISKAPRSSKWVCSYATKGHNIGMITAEVRISVLELYRDFKVVK